MSKMCNRRRCKQGFALTSSLLALFIALSLLPLVVSVFKFVGNLDFDYNIVNNEMALMDLRRVLLLSYDLEISDKELNFLYHNDEYSLSLVNNKLILKPGTQIYLNDIDDINFFTKNGCIYLSYVTNKGKEYEKNIGKEKGIYLDDFLDDNDECIEYIDGDV